MTVVDACTLSALYVRIHPRFLRVLKLNGLGAVEGGETLVGAAGEWVGRSPLA